MAYPASLKLEAIRLRTEHRRSFSEILETVKVAKSTLSLWLKDYPLTKDELSNRRDVVDLLSRQMLRGWPGRPALSTTDLGEACRQMICAKLMMKGVAVFRPLTENTPVDLLVLTGDGRPLKCQCKCVYKPVNQGSHIMRLTTVKRNGKSHRYTAQEVDLFLGYCPDNDTVYVVPFSEVSGKSSNVSIPVLNRASNTRACNWANNFSVFDSRTVSSAG